MNGRQKHSSSCGRAGMCRKAPLRKTDMSVRMMRVNTDPALDRLKLLCEVQIPKVKSWGKYVNRTTQVIMAIWLQSWEASAKQLLRTQIVVTCHSRKINGRTRWEKRLPCKHMDQREFRQIASTSISARRTRRTQWAVYNARVQNQREGQTEQAG